ncbi:hypothetical protein RR48_14206 [Papilio machaon]|uniref:MADF domain-containing protein n=1 Tax=Papilio machaon TaxID=76193 RepID=A0A194QLR2_PAPMA|nr:hypothetical protein RR48_14206 [Papilio machaon]
MTFDTERFITEIENRPAIWDTSSDEYSNRHLKKKSWEEVVQIFKEKDGMTKQEKKYMGDVLQKKWKSIRGCFMREIARQKAVRSGNGVGPRKSEYIYFKQLKFLKKVMVTRQSTQPSEIEEEHSQNDLDTDQSRPQQQHLNKGINSESGNDPLQEFLYKPIEQRDSYDFAEQDEDKMFLLSLVSTLKKVPEHKKIATKIRMMSLLEEATQTTSHTYYE